MASFTPHLRKRVSKWAVFRDNYARGDGDDGGNNDFSSIKPGEHFWKEFEDEHAEQAKKEYGIANYLEFSKEEHDYAIVAVGTTGTGKSSIVQLFCGDVAQVSHATISQTKTAELFEEIGDDRDEHRTWMDTQGTDDSDMDDTDERILKKIFKKLWMKKVHFIVVLWMISGDFDRQKGEYLRQAKFIQSLETENSKSNIWKSVLMIQKMGQLRPKMKKIRGVIDAAKNNGAKMVYLDEDSIRDHIVGFRCTEMIDDDPMYEALVEAETSREKLIELGYVNKTEMKAIIHERLTKLHCFMLEYKDLICEKCSLRGDPRYLYYKCHYEPKPFHPKQLIPYHPQELEEYHPLNTHIVHPGKVIHLHPKELEDYHPESIREIEEDDKENPNYDHPGEYVTIISGKFCCTKESQKYNCCQAQTKYAQGCRTQYQKKNVLLYPCCKKKKDKITDEEEKGCDDKFHGGCKKRFVCCQKPPDSDPCLSKYDCCDKQPNTEGCATLYKCCDEVDGTKGCKERFKCCKMPDGSRGCQDKWACCDQAPEEKGCQTVCSRCEVRWGHKPGCCWPEIMDDTKLEKEEDDPDYGDNYDEASNPVIQNEDNKNNAPDYGGDNISKLLSVAEEEDDNAPESSPAPMMGDIPDENQRGLSTDELL